MKTTFLKQNLPSALVVAFVLALFTFLGAYSYIKENNCHIAIKGVLLSSADTICDGPSQQTPAHVCQPGVACTN